MDYVRGLIPDANGVEAFATAESDIKLPTGGIRVEHHAGHAATAFASSPFQRAAVLVCDSQPGREVSLWTADAGGVAEADFRWRGPGFATVYSAATEAFGFVPQWVGGSDTPRIAETALTVRPEVRTFLADYMKNLPK